MSIAVNALQDTLEQLEKKLEYCLLAEKHGVDIKDVKEMTMDLIEMQGRKTAAPILPTSEASANKLWEAQQKAMEQAKYIK